MRTLIRFGACAGALVALVALVASPARAQGLMDRLKKKAAESVEKKAEEKIAGKIDQITQRMVDNSFSAMFGDSAGATASTPGGSGASGGSAGGSRGGLPFSIGSNAKTESAYTFNVVTTMEVESSRRGKSDGKAVMMMHFNTNEPYTGTSIVSADGKKLEGSAFVVLDAKNQAMVMMMASEKDNKKFSIAYAWKEAQKFAESANAPREQVNWDTVKVWRNYTRIGSKTIAGYAADGYRLESPEATTEIWVSRDKRLGLGNMFAANSGLKQMKGRLPAEYPQGMMLEMTNANTASGEMVTMRVTNIDTSARVSYAMSDYPKMEIGKQ